MEDPVSRALGPISGVFAVLFVSAILTGLSLLVSAMFSGWVVHKMRMADQSSRTCFWWGLAVSLILLILVAVLGHFGEQYPPLSVAAGILAVLLFVLASLGLVPVVRLVGRKVGQLTDRDFSPFWETSVGSLTLILSVFFPVIGWALFLYWTFVGIGTVVAPV
ncbi:MAG: hypothetical protein NZ959_05705 [Armatimonadetes bacterium]|nr:hypothetical protein [Armatimonadota bacterium]MDW8122421.1 hypothetical protein [Armatimonadota bacterium]